MCQMKQRVGGDVGCVILIEEPVNLAPACMHPLRQTRLVDAELLHAMSDLKSERLPCRCGIDHGRGTHLVKERLEGGTNGGSAHRDLLDPRLCSRSRWSMSVRLFFAVSSGSAVGSGCGGRRRVAKAPTHIKPPPNEGSAR